MGKRDDRIDAYIARSAEFARPILRHLREIVHEACPDVEETIKWGLPHFLHKGILCHMASFKEHCAFGIWKGSQIVEQGGGEVEKAMGQFGRISKLADLPSKKVLSSYIKQAMKRNEAGIKSPSRMRLKEKAPRELVIPDDLASALRAHNTASATFEKFSPSHRREYVAWITEAKTQATRTRRLEQAVQWLAEGKPRHWKYSKC